MTAYISCSDMLRDHAQCTVLTVHHSGKANDGARGHAFHSEQKPTDTEIELAIDETSGLRFAKATKQREIASNKEFAFELNTVTLGMDEDGDDKPPVATLLQLMRNAKEKPKSNSPKMKRSSLNALRNSGVST